MRYDWDRLGRLQETAGAPLVIKGCMSPRDAKIAAESGVAGIVVSNHGVGQRRARPNLSACFQQYAEVVEGRMPILVDGGFRRGGDVIKAIALGASGALVCRPVLWAWPPMEPKACRKSSRCSKARWPRIWSKSARSNLAAIRRDQVRVHRR